MKHFWNFLYTLKLPINLLWNTKETSFKTFVKHPKIFIVKTQRNSTYLNSTQSNSKATSIEVRHSSHLNPPTPNFLAPSGELKFGTNAH